MDVLLRLLGDSWIIGVLQLVLGAVIKPALKDKLLAIGVKATAFLPIINLIIAYIGLQLSPAAAEAAGFAPVKEGLAIAAMALIQTTAVTGTFSFSKNSLFPVAKALGGWLFSKIR